MMSTQCAVLFLHLDSDAWNQNHKAPSLCYDNMFIVLLTEYC